MSTYKCNLVVAGVGKGGTSSLHSCLDAHPKICMSSTKEPQYFSMDSQWNKGSGFHNSLFTSAKPNVKFYGESSTSYFASETAMKRIKNELKNPNIIFLLRDPVERTISHYRWMYALGLEKRGLIKAVTESGFGFEPNSSVNGSWCYTSYLEFSRYSKWVPMWQDLFGSENVLIIRSDDFKMKQDLVIRSCYCFLGVEDFFMEFREEINKTEDITITSQHRAVVKLKSIIPNQIKEFVKSNYPVIVKLSNCVTLKISRIPPPKISENEKLYLKELLSVELDYYSKLPHILNDSTC